MRVTTFTQPIVVDTDSGGASTIFNLSDKLYGTILIPSGANTAFSFYESDDASTWYLCNGVGTAGVLTVPSANSAPQSVALPSAILGSRFVKITSGAGSKVTCTLVTKTFQG